MTVVPLADYTAVDEADVYCSEVHIAVLRRRRDSVEFSYLANADIDVATSLPRAAGVLRTHASGALPPFFAGLLPEGRRMTALRAAVKTSADDEFSLLLAVGTDTVGNISIVPRGMGLAAESGDVTTIGPGDWARLDFTALFERSIGVDPDRSAVGGIQDKVSARMISFPVRAGDSSLTTHLLKLNPPEFPFVVENEAFFMQAARESGLRVANASVVHDADGRSGLLVERFDRQLAAGRIVRSAQEDACQVLGRYPADKYLVSTEETFASLVRLCRAGAVAALELVRQVAFAYLTCNGDTHAKNFSILRMAGEWRISPAYDVPTSYPYRDRTMALTINAKRDESIGRADLLALAAAIGLRARAGERAIDELLERCESWFQRLDELPFDARRIHDLRRAIAYRRQRLATPVHRQSRPAPPKTEPISESSPDR